MVRFGIESSVQRFSAAAIVSSAKHLFGGVSSFGGVRFIVGYHWTRGLAAAECNGTPWRASGDESHWVHQIATCLAFDTGEWMAINAWNWDWRGFGSIGDPALPSPWSAI